VLPKVTRRNICDIQPEYVMDLFIARKLTNISEVTVGKYQVSKNDKTLRK
jgi:hypothetical protein